MQVENALLRSQSDLRILAYHAAISDDRRTANLQARYRVAWGGIAVHVGSDIP